MRPAKALPESLEAEQAVLGACLLSRAAILRATELLTADSFLREGHRLIFAAVVALTARNVPVDLTTLAAELEARHHLQQVGGRLYLASLLDAVPTAEHVEHYADIVRQKALLRALLAACADGCEECYGEVEDADELAEARAERVAAVARAGRPGDMPAWELVITDVARTIAETRGKPRSVAGLPTSIPRLDMITNGIEPGYLSLISGVQGGGKSALAGQIALHNARQGTRVLYASLEMDYEVVVKRMVSHLAGVDFLRIHNGTTGQDESLRVDRALGDLLDMPLDIWAPETATPAQVLGKARDVMTDRGLGLLVVDHIGLLKSTRRYGNRIDEEADRAEQLRQGAKRMRLAILGCSQHRKPTQDRVSRVPTQHDLRGASELIDVPTLILILHEPKPPSDSGQPERVRQVQCIAAKVRNAPRGSVSLRWDAWCQRFYEETNE